jgi:hypothetical protein
MDKETIKVIRKERKKEKEETNKNRAIDSHNAIDKNNLKAS